MDRYWVPHPVHVWIPGLQQSTSGNNVIFKIDGGAEVSVPKVEAAALEAVQEDQLSGVDNICNLGFVTPGAVLHTIKVRYARQEIYTRVARILIATNPFQSVPIYGAQYVDQYAKVSDSLSLPPHVYGVGTDVLQGLRENQKNQAVLVSGESGAGKTETTKLMLSFMTEAIAGSSSVQDQILSTNPVLEAFGNAMTVRNNNSSRFGKWMEMGMDSALKIQGGRVVDYLLELTRVVQQGKGERNYHVFFQVLASPGDPLVSGLGLPPDGAKKFRYLCGGSAQAPGINDAKCFTELKEALSCLGLSDDQQKEIYSLVGAVLHVGNIDFSDKDDAACLKDEGPVQQASKLMHVDLEVLKKCLLWRKITIGRDVTETPLKEPQAKAARDALARLMYRFLFKYLIEKINVALASGCAQQGKSWFGVLDIAGFESFEHNSLEQLFINLGNEKLQMHFNNYVFKNELADYVAEGISVSQGLTFQDNSDVLALLEEKGGVLSMLDEEVFIPKATDMSFVSKVLKAHEKHPRLVVPKMGGKPVFGVSHFAGIVNYSCEGFLEKNVDQPPAEARALMSSSQMQLMKDLEGLVAADEAANAAPTTGRAAKRKTVSINFRTSLKELMDKLGEAEPNFIRCIKPNMEKAPFKFSNKPTMEQLLFSGIMEAVKIRQAGYSTRITFGEFFGRYRLLVPKKQRATFCAFRTDLDRCKKLVDLLPASIGQGISPGELVYGKAKVFAKQSVMNALEKVRPIIFAGAAVEVQRHWRGYKTRCKLHAARDLTKWLKERKLYQGGSASTAIGMFKTLDKVRAEVNRLDQLMKAVPGGLPILGMADRVMGRMSQEVAVLERMQALEKSIDATEIDATLARAKGLELPATTQSEKLRQRSAKLEIQYPLIRAMEDGIAQNNADQLRRCMEEIKSSGLSSGTGWLEGLNGTTLATQAFERLEQLKAKGKVDGIRATQQEQAQNSVFKEVEEIKKATAFEQDTTQKRRSTVNRKTVTGLSAEDQMQLLLQLSAAGMEYDAEKVDRLLREATRQGMGKSHLQEHRDIAAKLQSEAFLHQTMKEVEELLQSPDATETVIKQMQNLAKQVEKITGDPFVVQDAQQAIQKSMRLRARVQGRLSVFNEEMQQQGTEEVQVAMEAYDLINFPHLKKWFRGHRSAARLRVPTALNPQSGRGDLNAMVSHSRDYIKEAITVVPPSLESQAVLNFRNILGWMNDKPNVECRTLSYSHDIVDVAKSSQPMADEVYCQVLKQLTNNPSDSSAMLGWKLLLLLCQEVSPSEELVEFVRCFLTKSIRALRGRAEALSVASQCLHDLNLHQVTEEHGNRITVKVQLMDHSARNVSVPETGTLVEVAEILAAQLRVQRRWDFAFFQMIEMGKGDEAHNMLRMLPIKMAVSSVQTKFNSFKEKTKKESRLLWKRPFIGSSEALQAGDTVHAALTYHQVLYDYLHYPVCEPRDLVERCAAALLVAEHAANEHVRRKDISGPGVLENFVPVHMLKFEKDRRRWSRNIFAQVQMLQSQLTGAADSEVDRSTSEDVKNMRNMETRLQKMSRMLTLCQRMKLFGMQHWFAKQVVNVPPDKQFMEDAPEREIVINERAPCGEYWVCINRSGMTFVPYEGAPGDVFSRSFLYDAEAMDRLVRWGFKQDLVQLVVQAVDRENAAVGMVQWTLNLVTHSAVDICFALEFCTARKDKLRNQ